MTTPAPVGESAASATTVTGLGRPEVLDYAWKWFEYHAAQRLQAFRFFLIVLGALLLAIGNALKEGQAVLLFSAAAAGGVVAFVFLLLELRNEALVNVGRDALLQLEKSDPLLQAHAAFQLLHADRRRPILTSYKFCLRAIYVVSVVVFTAVALLFRDAVVPR
jgi:hypothetical protein